MDLDSHRLPLDAPGLPEIDGEIASQVGLDGQLEVEVIEHLRVKVPAAARAAWLEAEQASWEPWLQRQPGYLGRRLHWDAEQEEGQLLIRWASREQWHAIPRSEIEQVQERFEQHAHAAMERLGVLPPLLESAPAEPCQAEPSHSERPPLQSSPAGIPANPFPLVYSGELAPAAAKPRPTP